MKRFLLLLAAVGLVSCTETLDEGGPNEIPSQLEQLQKRFDFSEVDTEGLEIKKTYEAQYNESGRPLSDALAFEYAHPDLAVVVGEINKCLWLGLFDRESGQLKYQYTDIEHPVSYSAYGVEYEYGVGKIFGIYFENEEIVFLIQYPKNEFYDTARLDLITFDERTILAEVSRYESFNDSRVRTIPRWADDTLCFSFRGISSFSMNSIIYNIYQKKILCCAQEKTWMAGLEIYPFYKTIELKITGIIGLPSYVYPCYNGHILLSSSNPLHSWVVGFSNDMVCIMEHQCTYDTITTIREDINLFDPYIGDSSRAPRYSLEYRTRTDDHITAVVTQTEYDGTVTTKTVDARLENDELKVEVQ